MTDETNKPIEVTDDGATRVLKIGTHTITIDLTTAPPKTEHTQGILFDFDLFLVKLIANFDQANSIVMRDILLTLRSQLASQPQLVRGFQSLGASCVVLDNTDLVRIPRNVYEQMVALINDAASLTSDTTPTYRSPPSTLYVGDDDE